MTTNLHLRSARLPRAAAPAILLAIVAACAPAGPTPDPGGSGSPSASPNPTSPAMPSATPGGGGLEHPTGARDIVLRMEEGGGFVPVESLATWAPIFTLYGDGTVVFRDPTATPPDPIGNVRRLTPFQMVKLSEAGIQALLEEALGPGGLAIAKGPYIIGADMSTVTFTITVNGQTKSVSAAGLSPDLHPQDAAIIAALAHLAERLGSFGSSVGGEQPYVPAGYRGVLFPVEQPFGAVVAWPWPDITPDEFVEGEDSFFRARTMSAGELAALGLHGIEGGFDGLTLQRDGKLFAFALRPLLPDEDR